MSRSTDAPVGTGAVPHLQSISTPAIRASGDVRISADELIERLRNERFSPEGSEPGYRDWFNAGVDHSMRVVERMACPVERGLSELRDVDAIDSSGLNHLFDVGGES